MKTLVTTGAHTYGAPIVSGRNAHCSIGKFCSIGDNVRIDIGGGHNMKNISTYPFNIKFPEIAAQCATHPVCNGDVVIGNDVWIGFDVIILSGVTIGDGAVIGANSVVRENVDAYSLWAGTPAEFKKFRFSLAQRGMLEMLQWWDWPDRILFKSEVMEMLMSGDVEKLWGYWRGWSA